jgi:hypothetical protein
MLMMMILSHKEQRQKKPLSACSRWADNDLSGQLNNGCLGQAGQPFMCLKSIPSSALAPVTFFGSGQGNSSRSHNAAWVVQNQPIQFECLPQLNNIHRFKEHQLAHAIVSN